MSKALLISALLLAGLTASPHGALAQPQTDKPASEKKGPLGGLLEPWDGKGDEITPKTIHLGGIFEPWHATDDNRPKQEASMAEPTARKKGPLSGLLQPWDDKPTTVAKADVPAAKKKGLFGGLLQRQDNKHDDQAADAAKPAEPIADKTDEPATKKKGPLGGLLQPWDGSSDKP
jgi:hypothetical protein